MMEGILKNSRLFAKEKEKEDRTTGQTTGDHPFRRYYHVLPERQGMSLCQQAPRRVDGGA